MVGKIRDNFHSFTPRKMLDTIINNAITARASYIHIEPGDQEISVRYRVNAALIEASNFSRKRFYSLIEELKKLSNLDVRTRSIPQDGKFKLSLGNNTYSFQVSFIPTISGEKVSIKILNNSITAPSLVEMGYWGHGLEAVNSSLAKQNGIMLICGPKNSGKSLSLFSMLSSIKDPSVKIATIEDPVEYVIKGATQTQVNPRANLSLSTGFMALQKHDSDVIMISELKDRDIAELVFHYGGRDKLIISTLYADNAAEAINKLASMGISRIAMAHNLRLICSQRFVKRLCHNCRESFIPDKALIDLITGIFNLKQPQKIKVLHGLELTYAQSVAGNSKVNTKNLSATETKIRRLWREHKGGCYDCQFSGFRGDLGLYEIISNSSAVEKLLVSQASPETISSQAVKEGTIDILTDGLIKALQGEVAIDEIVNLRYGGG